jgi:pre-mRNA-processing factor 19
MSVTNCALSGLPLENPVVSVKSGHVFEKSLIEKHLLNTG